MMATAWTRPHAGATLSDMDRLLHPKNNPPETPKLYRAERHIRELAATHPWTYRTNLEIIGQKVSGYDLDRIASME